MILIRELENILPVERILVGELLADHCSFRTGGPASYYLQVENTGALTCCAALLRPNALTSL